MEKQVIRAAGVPETGGPFNLCVRHGNMLYVSGLPPFEEEYCALLRAARARGEPPPPFPDLPFERQVRIVMDHLQRLVEAAPVHRPVGQQAADTGQLLEPGHERG